MSETITISKAEYERLKKDQRWLWDLEAVGVDNWQGIDEAIEFRREREAENE